MSFLFFALTAALSFYAGWMLGTTRTVYDNGSATMEQEIQKRVRVEIRRIQQHQQKPVVDDTASRFPVGLQDVTVGMSVVDRDEFASVLKMGVPLDKTSRKNSQVLILYQSSAALPNDPYVAAEAVAQTALPSVSSVKAAVENCDYLNVILTDHSSRRQCTALMGQYEAFHIQKYMRLPEESTGGKLDVQLPLRLVNRGAQPNGRKSTKPPSREHTRAYWTILQTYLSHFDTVLAELKPIVEKVAVDNTVIVMVCNFGQSELLLNFVCAAQSRALSLSHILVFATDIETRDLCIGLNLAVYYDATNYLDMPKTAASRYADKAFTSMMLAKVFCVHLTTWLGYDVLFQDVDVIWYKDPLLYFHDETAPPETKDFDIYFQDEYVALLYIMWLLLCNGQQLAYEFLASTLKLTHNTPFTFFSFLLRFNPPQRQPRLVLCTVFSQYGLLLRPRQCADAALF